MMDAARIAIMTAVAVGTVFVIAGVILSAADEWWDNRRKR